MARSNSMLSVTLLVLVAMVTVSVVQSDSDKLYKKYGTIKIYESCFGKSAMKTYNKKKMEICDLCNKRPVHINKKDQTVVNLTVSRAIESNAASTTTTPKPTTTTASSSTTPAVLKSDDVLEYRYFTRERVDKLVSKMEAKVSNITCVMREYGYMDENDELVYDNMTSKFNEMKDLDPKLKEDLIQSIQDCKALATCAPIEKMLAPVTPAIIRFSCFMKCLKKKKFNACMKKDLRERRDEFDLSGFADTTDIDDDDKMLNIMWASAVPNHYDF